MRLVVSKEKTEYNINKLNGIGNGLRFVLSCCLIEHFNISWSERFASCKRCMAGRTSGRIPWGKAV